MPIFQHDALTVARYVFTTLVMAASAAASARDALPLKRGIYVAAGSRCKGASNAVTLSYWGGQNGINEQRRKCTIKTHHVDGTTHILSRSCYDIREEQSFDDQFAVKILSRRSFITGNRVYRYCGPKVRF